MTAQFRSAIIGAPGSGKGTLARKIIEKYDVYHLCTGDVFRQHIEMKTDLGKSVEKYMSEGKFVPDVLVNRVVSKMLKEVNNKSVLLDGFPRNKLQGEKLFMAFPLHFVIFLKVPYDVIIDRVKGRWVHPPSGRIYNTIFKPPKVPGMDDVTGEPLIQRPDDAPETLKNRLKLFDESTEPLLQFLKKQKVLKQFKGMTSNEIWVDVDKALLEFLKPKS